MIDSGVGVTTGDVPTGNTFDKYGSTNPVVRRLMGGFHSALDDLMNIAKPSSILDVGCGEGILTRKWAEQLGDGPVVGVDFDDPKLEQEWKRRTDLPNLTFKPALGEDLPFDDNQFDTVCALEVLEHVPDPQRVLKEMSRVGSDWLLLSVPREPLWRALNIARGAYLKDLGNTPGHLNHWSKRSFTRLLQRHGAVNEVRMPPPWTMALVRL